jgi:hypothetical protein
MRSLRSAKSTVASNKENEKEKKIGKKGKEKSNWVLVSKQLAAEAKEDVPTQVVCSANTAAAQRTQIHQKLVFHSRYRGAHPAFAAPVGIGDPTVGGVMEFNFQSSAGHFEFLQACSQIGWGGGVLTRFSIRAQRPSGNAWSTNYEARY